MRAIYSVVDQLPESFRRNQYFSVTLERQLGKTTRELEVWLTHAELLVQQGLAEAAQTLAAGHLDIREYFFPIGNPPPPD